MTPLPLHHFLVVGAILFALGMIGFLARRNLIVMFLSAEMMLQGVALNLVAFARYRGNLQGQAFTLFIITVAACEAAIALALILMLYRRRHSLDVSQWQELREPGHAATVDEEPLPRLDGAAPAPKLTPAGIEPEHRQETSHV
jgi:NADH-quinone oxidoreductase subunit K